MYEKIFLMKEVVIIKLALVIITQIVGTKHSYSVIQGRAVPDIIFM